MYTDVCCSGPGCDIHTSQGGAALTPLQGSQSHLEACLMLSLVPVDLNLVIAVVSQGDLGRFRSPAQIGLLLTN